MSDWARVKDAVDIAEVVGRYVPLKPKGPRLVGLCPFHAEKTPSFGVLRDRQMFKCFGCGKGGDVFVFLQEHLRLDKAESLRMLAEEAGIQLTERSPGAKRRQDRRDRALVALGEAARRYRAELKGPRGEPARAFLQRRCIGEQVTADFGLGFAPARGFHLAADLQKAGHRLEDLELAGLARRRDGRVRDAFWDRVLVPIRDERGRVLAFGGRRLIDGPGAPEPKYINSAESEVFHKSRVLFGMDRARSEILKVDRAVLVEGYTDVLLAHQAGLTCTVAALGTAITADHAKALQRLAAEVVLFLDADAAGAKAALRAAPILLNAGLKVRVLRLEEGADPGDYFSSGKTLEDFDALLERNGLSAVDFVMRSHGVHRAHEFDERRAAAADCMEVFGQIEDEVVRSLALGTLAEELGLPPETLRRSVAQARERRRPAGKPSGPGPGKDRAPAPEPAKVKPEHLQPRTGAQAEAELHVLVGLFALPENRKTVHRFVALKVFRDPLNRRLCELLVANPDGEILELFDRIMADGPAQARLLEVERIAETGDAGKMYDGAIQYLKRAGQERRKRELREEHREQEQQAVPTDDSKKQQVLSFLRAYQDESRNAGPEQPDRT